MPSCGSGRWKLLEVMAEHRIEKALLKEFSADRKKAQASTEEQFWNQELGYYQYNAHNSDIMADATVGERYVDVTGLLPVVNAEPSHIALPATVQARGVAA